MERIVRKVKGKKFGSIEKNSGECIRKHVVPQCVFTKIKRTFYYVIAYDCIITKFFLWMKRNVTWTKKLTVPKEVEAAHLTAIFCELLDIFHEWRLLHGSEARILFLIKMGAKGIKAVFFANLVFLKPFLILSCA